MNKFAEFGSMVFGDSIMREKLPKDVYNSLKRTIAEGKELDLAVANVVAAAMKDWAIEKGATHYTHWFQPMTGVCAEKHDSFLSPTKDGGAMAEFSGKALIKGESDASSFPSGGLRATFEARGYTAWDATSYAFIKDDVLCIPTAFCSFGGEVLDKKTPLLRSTEALNRQALRLLRVFGDTSTKRVISTAGAEQEYFIIRREEYEQREDLIYTGRTLFGAKQPKGQELDDQYYAAIKPQVKEFMNDLNQELWRLGIYAKTEHNEVAPAQHELAPVFESTNAATDHNQLTMEMMKKVASRHGLVCLLHEKPFAGVNGSGKHNNWSMATDTGVNLLDPGDHPEDNPQFLTFLAAVIAAADNYQDLLRISSASAGNDHRLGANEAPPAIISLFLGDELSAVIEAILSGHKVFGAEKTEMDFGSGAIAKFKRDTTDRNRTSSFAFTGNKFEFRMLGSSFSIADTNTVINTAVAEEISRIADVLEACDTEESRIAALNTVLHDTIAAHKRILFDGNGYSEEWVREAEVRGLMNIPSSADAIPLLASEKNVALFAKHNIFTRQELESRCEIQLESYVKIINIEALTMVDMARKQIIPAVLKYVNMLTDTASKKAKVNLPAKLEMKYVTKLSELCERADEACEDLSRKTGALSGYTNNVFASSQYCKTDVLPAMAHLRALADEMETCTAAEYWPFPTYGKILFAIGE